MKLEQDLLKLQEDDLELDDECVSHNMNRIRNRASLLYFIIAELFLHSGGGQGTVRIRGILESTTESEGCSAT